MGPGRPEENRRSGAGKGKKSSRDPLPGKGLASPDPTGEPWSLNYTHKFVPFIRLPDEWQDIQLHWNFRYTNIAWEKFILKTKLLLTWCSNFIGHPIFLLVNLETLQRPGYWDFVLRPVWVGHRDGVGVGAGTEPVKKVERIHVKHQQCLLASWTVSFSPHNVLSPFLSSVETWSFPKEPALLCHSHGGELPFLCDKIGFLQLFAVASRSQIHCFDSSELKSLFFELWLPGYCLLPTCHFAYS